MAAVEYRLGSVLHEL